MTDKGDSKLIKWHWKSKQGLASLYQEESQHISGKGADFHRQDLYDSIEAGNFPEWELGVQMVDEDKALAFGFDLLDPTKMLPEELAPVQKLGVMRLGANPAHYFAETEQVINRGYPQQANQSTGRGFFTAPGRQANGHLVRTRSETISNHWSQPRLFYNSISEVEQQMTIEVLRFELSVLQKDIQKNVLAQLNTISHDTAKRIGEAIDMEAPAPDDRYLFDRKAKSRFYPAGCPAQIVTDSFHWGKPLGFVGSGSGKDAINATGVKAGPGVYERDDAASVVNDIKDGLATFKFLERIALDDAK